ncbi:MAG: SDR family oxidoreductase [Magnetococcales bacterium]|nr:SDR family oxidoreductase [Magnetococcales bacterium]
MNATHPSLLILGATGMLGRALLAEGVARHVPVTGVARSGAEESVDLLDDDALLRLVERRRPGIIVNAAALVDLAGCERDPGLAYRINARGVAILAEAARRQGAWLIQISTDHYFTGDGAQPHDETAAPRLLNEYARGKLAGEHFALTASAALVVRTNIVGFRGRGAPTFVEWILREFRNDRTIRAFEDYFVSSLSARQCARCLFDLLPWRPTGILNLAAGEVFSKRRFIEAVREGLMGGRGTIEPARVSELGTPPRAESLGLDVRRIEALLGRAMPTLNEVVADLAAELNGDQKCVMTA